jgi:hypothetical protein
MFFVKLVKVFGKFLQIYESTNPLSEDKGGVTAIKSAEDIVYTEYAFHIA